MSESRVTVLDWLCVLRLEQYFEAFQSVGLVTLRQCRDLRPDQLEQMGITLPGHQRRILASLNKTHGKSDTYSQPGQFERDQRLEETGNAHVLQNKRPVPIPGEEKAVLKEREKRDGETLRPAPREREKPVPKERQVPSVKEDIEDGGEKKPVPVQRHITPRGGIDGEKDGGIDGEREKPVPKERTKFRSNAQADCHPSSSLSSTSDPSLPPVPPRSTPNCPPQRFTSPMSPSPPARNAVSPKLDTHVAKAPAVSSRQASQNSTPTGTPTHTPTHAPLHPPNFPSAQARPQTLAIQPSAQHLGGDGRRKSLPGSPVAFPLNDRNVPPLPPKAGATPKGPPPVPQRCPALSPRTHSPTKTVADEMQKEQTPQVPPRIRTPQTLENTQQSTQPDTYPTVPTRIVSQPHCDSRLVSVDDDSDHYEDPDLLYPGVHRLNTPDGDMTLQVPGQRKGRYSSLCSDDEMLDDDE